MASGLLGPLAIFCTQSQSQQYIRSVRNLGDAWRTLSEKSDERADSDTTFIGTAFDFNLKVKNHPDETISTEFEIPSLETTTDSQPISTELQRHYRIFADYGSDFLWRNTDDPDYSEDNTYVEAEDALSDFPPEVFRYYDS